MDTVLGVIIGFVAGYVLGSKEGLSSMTELRESWKVISSSEDVQAIWNGAPVIAMAILRQWLGGLTHMDGHK